MSCTPSENKDLDMIYCRYISKSIAEVIRFSLDEPFRRRSFELFGVSCTVDTEKEIHKKLMSLIDKQNSEKSQNPEDGEIIEVDPPELSPNITADEEDETEAKTVKRSWLQISSQQYKESFKYRRTYFYSQPENRNHFFDPNDSHQSCEAMSSFSSADSYFNEKLKANQFRSYQ